MREEKRGRENEKTLTEKWAKVRTGKWAKVRKGKENR